MNYEIVIKGIKSGEVIRRAEGDCIICAVSSLKDEEVLAKSINYVDAPIAACLGAAAAVQDSLDEIKQNLLESLREELGEKASPEIIEALLRAMAKSDIGNKEAEW
jgi:3-deoxy-D-manno-octulosonate 8-phosphate phosphatase KdsC-like HAD superfamily phosphatase